MNDYILIKDNKSLKMRKKNWGKLEMLIELGTLTYPTNFTNPANANEVSVLTRTK